MPRKLKSAKAHAAQQRVLDRIDAGKMTRPSACSKCGKAGPTQFAHSKYDGGAPKGSFMCQSCHGKADAKNPKGGGSGSKGTEKAK